MQFDPVTKLLYTDEGVLIKKLRCPIGATLGDLERALQTGIARCRHCEHQIHSTNGLSDGAVLSMVRANPGTCLSVNLSQTNIRVVLHHGRTASAV